MESIKIDILKSLKENLDTLMVENEVILMEFEVAPLDYLVQDFTSPRIFISQIRLFFSYDEVVEIYNLSELELEYIGERPRFSMHWQIFEGRYLYSDFEPNAVQKMRESDMLSKFAFNESGKIFKEFVLRDGYTVAKNFKTWAMYRLIKNMKENRPIDENLKEMVVGSFVKFNTRTLMTFIVVFIIYMALLLISSLGFPTLFRSFIDFVFMAVVLVMAVWSYISMTSNLKQHYNVYLFYENQQREESR